MGGAAPPLALLGATGGTAGTGRPLLAAVRERREAR